MGFGSVWHWVIVALVVLVLFGRGRISEMMGDLGKGVKSFKEGMSEEADRPLPPRIAATPAATADPAPAPPVIDAPAAADPAVSPAPRDDAA